MTLEVTAWLPLCVVDGVSDVVGVTVQLGVGLEDRLPLCVWLGVLDDDDVAAWLRLWVSDEDCVWLGVLDDDEVAPCELL